MAVKHVTLRAWSDNSDVAPVKINQGDILSRTIIMTLLDSTGAPIDLTLSSARVHFSKPDGTVVYLTASIVNAAAGIISVTLDSQCTAVPGLVKTIVQVTSPDGENMYCTGPKISVGAINVENSVASSNEFTALTEALAQVQNIANKADLNADGKVIQDPASYGQVGGAALISALPESAVPVKLNPDGTLSETDGIATLNSDGKVVQDPATSYLPLPETDDNSTHQHWAKYADGTMHQWGYVTDNISVSTAAGALYMLNPYTFTLPQPFVVKESVVGNVVSNGLLIAINTSGTGSGNQLAYRILSPVSLSNLAITLMYDAWGRWK